LREMPVWLKVTLNERDQWKQPCVEFRGRLVPWNWQISSYHLALDKVLKQQPEGKAGFYASDSLCVIDLDDVIDRVTRQLKEPKVHDLFEYLKASVYVSSSGKGLHIIFRLQEGVEIDLVQDLLRTMTFPWHFCLPSIHPVSDLSTGLV